MGFDAAQAHQMPDGRTVGRPKKDDLLKMLCDGFLLHQGIADLDVEDRENAEAKIWGLLLSQHSK